MVNGVHERAAAVPIVQRRREVEPALGANLEQEVARANSLK
jgi:hypothetical protein